MRAPHQPPSKSLQHPPRKGGGGDKNIWFYSANSHDFQGQRNTNVGFLRLFFPPPLPPQWIIDPVHTKKKPALPSSSQLLLTRASKSYFNFRRAFVRELSWLKGPVRYCCKKSLRPRLFPPSNSYSALWGFAIQGLIGQQPKEWPQWLGSQHGSGLWV